MNKKTIIYSIKSALPVMTGYIVLSIGFGLLLQDKGYGCGLAVLMSTGIYAGSMQFVTINLLSTGASIITTAIMTLMVNIRHLFYGITMLKEYSEAGWRKPYLIFSLTDETYSLICSPDLPDDINRKDYFFIVSFVNQLSWIAGSIIGSVLGNTIPFDTTGIDFAMTALFVIILVEQLEKSKQHLPAITGFIISIFCLLLFGPNQFLIPSMILITIALFIEKKSLERSDF